MRLLCMAAALVAIGGGIPTMLHAQDRATASPSGGTVVQPWEGQRLTFCNAPELTVTLKVDSASAGARRFSMGTGELAPRTSNTSTGHNHDEIIYFTRGMGKATLAGDTVPVHAGTTLFVPERLRHSFINPADMPLEFVWIVAPRGFEDVLRRTGVQPGTACPARGEDSPSHR